MEIDHGVLALFTNPEKNDFTEIEMTDGKKRKRYSTKVKQKAKTLVKQGKTRIELAEALGVSPAVIGTWVNPKKKKSVEEEIIERDSKIADLEKQISELTLQVEKMKTDKIEAEAEIRVLTRLLKPS